MTEKDLRKILEDSNDKLNIFADKSILNSCTDLTVKSLLDLIDTFLNDAQKVVLLGFEHFRNLSAYIRSSIVMSISDRNLKIQLLLENNGPLSDFKDYQIADFVKSLDNFCKLILLKNPTSIKSLKLSKYNMISIISSLSDNEKFDLLEDNNYVKDQLCLDEYSIVNIIKSVNDKTIKLSLLNSSSISSYYQADIISTFSDKLKEEVLLSNTYDLKRYDLITIFSSMDTDFLITCFNKNNDFLVENEISVQSVVRFLNVEKQLDFINKIDTVNISLRRKKNNLCDFR